MKRKKSSTPNYVVYFPLITEQWQEDLLEKFFYHINRLENDFVHIIKYMMKKNEDKFNEIKDINKQIGNFPPEEKRTKEEEKEIKQLKDLRKEILLSITTDEVPELKSYPKTCSFFSENGFVAVCNKLLYNKIGGINEQGNDLTYTSLFPCIGTNTTSVIGENKYAAFERFMFGNGKSIHYKKPNETKTVTYKVTDNQTSCTIDKENKCLVLKKSQGFNKGKIMNIPLKLKKSNSTKMNEGVIYEQMALECKIVKITIKREMVRGKYKYYVQLTVEGIPYNKGRKLGEGVIGNDPGISHITCYGKNVLQYSVPNEILNLGKKETEIQRAIERSLRLHNPNKYNDNGTIKENNRDKWVVTKNCKKLKNQLKEIKRKIKAKRNVCEDEFVIKVLSEGNEIHVENTNIEGMAKRAKGIRYKKDGTYQSNKRYGKSIGNAAPSSVNTKLKNKFKYLGGTYIEINSKDAKATGTDHTRLTKSDNFSDYTKEEYYTKIENGKAIQLSNGDIHDRDAHSAFNLKHFNPNTKEYDIIGMKEDYDKFCKAENEAFERNELDKKKLMRYQSTVKNN